MARHGRGDLFSEEEKRAAINNFFPGPCDPCVHDVHSRQAHGVHRDYNKAFGTVGMPRVGLRQNCALTRPLELLLRFARQTPPELHGNCARNL